jgi:hypothetical protein
MEIPIYALVLRAMLLIEIEMLGRGGTGYVGEGGDGGQSCRARSRREVL